jgi:squalene synthase HpnC
VSLRSPGNGTLTAAYAACATLAQSHYENFPVASRLFPAFMRPHVAAVYAFARIADDIADEGGDAPDVRSMRLRAWGDRLHAAVASTADPGGAAAVPRPADIAAATALDGPDAMTSHIIAATSETIRRLDLPIALFDDLLSAFGQDITTTRYDSWRDVLDYCRRSAEPVGRLVLRIAGYRDGALDRSSDALCTALQLTNFWQDFGRDFRAGRLYVPHETQTRAGASEDDLSAGRWSPAWTRALDECIATTRAAFERGRHVCDGVTGRLRFELRLTWHGGACILDRVERRRGDLLAHRPTLGRADVPRLLWRTLRWAAV